MSKNIEDNEFLEQIKYVLKVMNPISMESLAFHLKVKVEYLKKLITKFVNDGQLNAKIINDYVYYAIWEANFHEWKNDLQD